MSWSRKGKDLTGMQFNHWTVLNEAGVNKHRMKLYQCRCSCGSIAIVIGGSLTSGKSKKCSTHPKNEYIERDGYILLDVSTPSMPDTFTKIDTDDLSKVVNYVSPHGNARWRVHDSSGGTSQGRWGIYVVAGVTKLHRVILNVKSPDLIVDHINGDTLDNRKCNLRVISRRENNKNMKMHITNTSGYTGVTYCKKRNSYASDIQLNGKRIRLGTFSTAYEASIAYDAAAKALGFSERHGK